MIRFLIVLVFCVSYAMPARASIPGAEKAVPDLSFLCTDGDHNTGSLAKIASVCANDAAWRERRLPFDQVQHRAITEDSIVWDLKEAAMANRRLGKFSLARAQLRRARTSAQYMQSHPINPQMYKNSQRELALISRLLLQLENQR